MAEATFEEAIQARIADPENQTGWQQTDSKIVAEAAEEFVDGPAWLRGLDYDALMPKEQELVDRIEGASQSVWDDAERLRRMLESRGR